MDNELNFLIEQIETDLDAGYITERAKWRKALDNPAWRGPDGDNPEIFYHHANGELGSFSKKDADPSNTSDEALYFQNTDTDSKKTGYYKSIVASVLSKYMRYYDYEEFSPEKIANHIASEVNDRKIGVFMDTYYKIKPEAAYQLCRSYIQSALASAQGDKKKKLLMLLKTIKNPEFLNTLKKRLGKKKSAFKPWTWFTRTDNPNTKGRLADV